jgi:predicted Zn-dependent protease with MMP-like domain
MNRADFINFAEEALDSLPEEFRSRIQNVAILVEDCPSNQPRSQHRQGNLLLKGSRSNCRMAP